MRIMSAADSDQPYIMIMETITMNQDETDPKGAILSGSFAIFDALEHCQKKGQSKSV